MKIALFLDVDGVLTHEPVNLQIARLLKVDAELQAVEERWLSGMTNEEFNGELIPLFTSRGFDESFVEREYEDIRLRIHAEHLLHAPADVYLVSSGPSYYIEVLAQKHDLPDERVLCSKYDWHGPAPYRLRCTSPVTHFNKAEFVARHIRQGGYDLTIGVGDNTSQDSAFLAHCDVRVLVHGFEQGFLCAQDPSAVLGLIRALKTSKRDWIDTGFHQLQSLDPRPGVFIVAPFLFDDPAVRATIESIQESLSELGYNGWIASDYDLNPNLWANTQVLMHSCQAAIAVFVDESQARGEPGSLYNPNVAMEVGYLRALGKPVLLLKDDRLEHLPTDLLGDLYAEYPFTDARGSIPGLVRRFVNQSL